MLIGCSLKRVTIITSRLTLQKVIAVIITNLGGMAILVFSQEAYGLLSSKIHEDGVPQSPVVEAQVRMRLYPKYRVTEKVGEGGRKPKIHFQGG